MKRDSVKGGAIYFENHALEQPLIFESKTMACVRTKDTVKCSEVDNMPSPRLGLTAFALGLVILLVAVVVERPRREKKNPSTFRSRPMEA